MAQRLQPLRACEACGRAGGAPAYAAEAAAIAGATKLAVFGLGGLAVAAYAWWTAAPIMLAFVDLAVMRLPHRTPALATGGILGLLAFDSPPGAWSRVVTAALVVAGFLAALAVVSRGQLGWDDVSLAVPPAAALGWHSWTAAYTGVLLGFGTAALTAITLRRLERLAPGARRFTAARPVPDRRRLRAVAIWP